MKHALIGVVLTIVGISGATAATNASGVALCVDCTTASEFKAAGIIEAGTAFNGQRTILVVNPDTADSRWVIVTHTPPGQQPLSSLPKSPTIAPDGVAIPMGADPLSRVFVAGDEHTSLFQQQSAGSTAMAWPVSADEQSEIN